jgi:TPR repeat protein
MIASWICSESTKSGEMALRWVKIMSIAAFTFFAASVSADDLNNGFVKLSEGKPEEAIKLWTPLAESGDKVAQASRGLLYQTGQGVPKDQVRAVELFKRSAKQGYPFAFTALANSYYEGLGVEKSSKKALYWFLLSAEFDPNAAFMVQAIAEEIPEAIFDETVSQAIACEASRYSECGL